MHSNAGTVGSDINPRSDIDFLDDAPWGHIRMAVDDEPPDENANYRRFALAVISMAVRDLQQLARTDVERAARQLAYMSVQEAWSIWADAIGIDGHALADALATRIGAWQVYAEGEVA